MTDTQNEPKAITESPAIVTESLDCREPIETRIAAIEKRVRKLEEWVDAWEEFLKVLSERRALARQRNANLVLTESFNPWAETTTVEQLLHFLESECPVSTVMSAFLKKESTKQEKARLTTDLYHIAQECIEAAKAVNVFKEDIEEDNEKATQEQEEVLQDVQTPQDGMEQPMEDQGAGSSQAL